MNFKSRAIGIIAGTALTLSIISGTTAQENEQNINITLDPRACSPYMESVSATSFGTWVYDPNLFGLGNSGLAFVEGPNAVKSITFQVRSGSLAACDITVAAEELQKSGVTHASIEVGLSSGELEPSFSDIGQAASITLADVPMTGTNASISVAYETQNPPRLTIDTFGAPLTSADLGEFQTTIVLTDASASSGPGE